MKYPVGTYVIYKKALWTHDKAILLTIHEVDEASDEVLYYYDDQTHIIRCRSVLEFEDITLLPSSPLLKELV